MSLDDRGTEGGGRIIVMAITSVRVDVRTLVGWSVKVGEWKIIEQVDLAIPDADAEQRAEEIVEAEAEALDAWYGEEY